MNKFWILFVAFTLLSVEIFAQNKHLGSFHYTGSHWEKYNGYRMEIVVLDTSVAGTKLIAKQIINDGKFDVKGNIQYPQNAFFGLYNPDGDFVYKQEFIVEPGNLSIDHDKTSGDKIVAGGKYNPVFIALNNDPELISKSKELKNLGVKLAESNYKDTVLRKEYLEQSNALQKFKMGLYNKLRVENSDPLVRLLAMYHSERTNGYKEILDNLENKLGALPEISYLKYNLKLSQERRNNSSAIKVGTIIKDFQANDLVGTSFHLNEILKKNKYTLVEFWASWCGPCRAEIPNMKTAYKKFQNKGFEIVSFTLDHEEDRWKKASREESLPWINVGDLMAFKSPVVKMFGISGIPANYLVDPSGKIIAINLRQEKLDAKLSELLGM